MEEKGKQKENQLKLEVQLQREKLEFKKEQFYLKEKKGHRGKGSIKASSKKERIVTLFLRPPASMMPTLLNPGN
jgi:hypothetical protein